MLQPRHRGRSAPAAGARRRWRRGCGVRDSLMLQRTGAGLSLRPCCLCSAAGRAGPALLRAVGWFDMGHPPSRALSFPSLASHQPCRVMPGSVLPLPGKVSEVSVLANSVVPRAAPTPRLHLSSAQHRRRGWELLAPGALGCTGLMLLRLEGATRRFSITASLFPLPAQGAQLRGIRLGNAGGFLIPVLMGCWRCLASSALVPQAGSGSLLIVPGQ